MIITAVVLEGRSQADVARDYGVSKGWVSKLVARYRAEGDAVPKPRSRRPNTSPTALGPELVAVDLAASPRARHRWPRRRMRHDRVAPRTPPPDTGLDLDDPPLPHRSRRDHPEPQEATEIVLHPLPSRSSQRVLAIRLHPLAPRRWRRYRSPRVARRPLPLRTLDHRALPRHRHSCDRDVLATSPPMGRRPQR